MTEVISILNKPMTTAFNKILIPVDFSLNTETAVKKAIGFADPENAFIYLLHIIKPGTSAAHKYIAGVADEKLRQWKDTIEETAPGISVKADLLRGVSVQQAIVDATRVVGPDLIVIGKQDGRRNWFLRPGVSPDKIAEKTNCPVLTAKPGSIHSKTKIIVIPIRHFVPERKIDLAVLIAEKYRAQVHLLAIGGDNWKADGDLTSTFLQTYHQLREKLRHPIEYFSINSRNLARDTLEYADSIMADMILVNPAAESGISNFAGSRHISDFIARDSKLQVLDVVPYA